MSCRRGRCPGSELKGSGYTKPANTELARENASAVEALLAARAAQDAKWAAAWVAAAASNPAGPLQGIENAGTPPHRPASCDQQPGTR